MAKSLLHPKNHAEYTAPDGEVYKVQFYYEGKKFIAGSLEREPYYPQLIIHSVTDMQGNEVDTYVDEIYEYIENLQPCQDHTIPGFTNS